MRVLDHKLFRLARLRRGAVLQLRSNATRAGDERNLRSPRQLYEHLSQYIVGQDRAKRILSVAVFNHYQRIRSRSSIEDSPPAPTPAGTTAAKQPVDTPTAGPSTLPPSFPASSLRRDSALPDALSSRQADLARLGTSLSDGIKTDRSRIPASDTDPSPELTARWAREGYFDSRPPPSSTLVGEVVRGRREAGRPRRAEVESTNWEESDRRREKQTSQRLLDVPGRSEDGNESRRPEGVEIEKSNVLMIGPTGTGKTLMTRTLAKILDVPFATCDATTYTSAGYVGEDVENCILRLLQASEYDVGRAEIGIIHIDEVDKLSRRGAGDGFATWGGGRDVGGEGVQQAFLRLLEGTSVTLSAKPPPTTSGSGSSKAEEPVWDPNNPMNRSFGTAASGKRGVKEGLPGFGGGSAGGKGETFVVDTTNILFICSGAFVGLESIVNSRLGKGSIGFGAPLPTPPPDQASPSYSPNPQPLNGLSTPDLTSYGLIPEFLGRLPILSNLHPLSIPDLVRILTEPRNSLVKQYMSIFSSYDSELRFTRKALEAVAKEGLGRGGGARGLRGVLEEVLADAMFEVPGSSVRYCLITEGVVKKDEPALYFSRGQRFGFERRVEQEDGPLGEEVEERWEEEEKVRASG